MTAIEELVKKLDDMLGDLAEIQALNEVVTEFINDVQDINQNSVKLIKERAYRHVYFTHIIDEKTEQLMTEIDKLSLKHSPCQQ